MAVLLPPALRAELGTLAIVPRLPPHHGPLGQNASRQRGTGLEFSQYRAYEPGDEPRRIDWKLYARSDRYYVREAESEAALAVWVVLDASASMAQVDEGGGPGRWDEARAAAAATLEVALRQGDRFGLLLVGDGGLRWLPAGAGRQQRDRCLVALEAARPGGAWPGEDALRTAWSRIAPAAVVVMIGDGFDAAGTSFAERLAATGRDVRCLSISTRDEREFPLRGGAVFVDPETGDEIELDAAAVRATFLEQFDAARRALDRRMAAAGVRHLEHRMGRPLAGALRALLGDRALRAGAA